MKKPLTRNACDGPRDTLLTASTKTGIIDDLKLVIVCIRHISVFAVDEFVFFGELLCFFVLESLERLGDGNAQYLTPATGTTSGIKAIRDIGIRLRSC